MVNLYNPLSINNINIKQILFVSETTTTFLSEVDKKVEYRNLWENMYRISLFVD